MKRLSRPQTIAVGVAAAVVVAGSAVAMASMGGGGSETASTPAPPGLEEAAAVAQALAGLAAKPDELVAADVRSAVGARAREALAPNATVNPLEASWQPDGLGGGTMTVTVANPGQPPATYTAVMVKEASGWKVAGTVPLTPTNTGVFPAVPGQAPAPMPPNVAAPQPGSPAAPVAGAGTGR